MWLAFALRLNLDLAGSLLLAYVFVCLDVVLQLEAQALGLGRCRNLNATSERRDLVQGLGPLASPGACNPSVELVDVCLTQKFN